MKKIPYIIMLVFISALLISCTKQSFKNFKYEGENNTWKVTANQYQTNDIDIVFEYKGEEKLPEMIKIKYYLDKDGYSSEGVIHKTSSSNKFSVRSKVAIDPTNKHQLKLTKITIKYDNRSEDIKLNCYENK